MSVMTTADKKINKAKDHIQEAIEYLSEVVIAKCCGTDEYNSGYIKSLRRQLIALLEISDNL